jgi:voltage-gated potassium channel
MKMINKQKLHKIIFESDSKAGKQFDVILLWSIVFSIIIAMLDSVPDLHSRFKDEFYFIEWFFTVVFTVEYALRFYVSIKPSSYVFSFWGFIDLFSILPTYLSLLFYGYQYLLVVRIFRLLRVFRILKLVRFNKEAILLISALKASAYKIGIFLSAVLAFAVIFGTVLYVVEGGEHGFSSIPQSIYWAIITITTVGYGDIVPHSVLGKFISSFAMIIGYAIIAVPTGIVTVEMAKLSENKFDCANCGFPASDHSKYCSNCGHKIEYTNNGKQQS